MIYRYIDTFIRRHIIIIDIITDIIINNNNTTTSSSVHTHNNYPHQLTKYFIIM